MPAPFRRLAAVAEAEPLLLRTLSAEAVSLVVAPPPWGSGRRPPPSPDPAEMGGGGDEREEARAAAAARVAMMDRSRVLGSYIRAGRQKQRELGRRLGKESRHWRQWCRLH